MLTSAVEPLLSVTALESGYGKIRVLHGIDFEVAPGEVVALLGPNGAGKTTMLRALQGLVRRPRLLMLDEPSAGLSPVLVDRVLDVIARLRSQGTAVLLVEQLLEKALASADRVCALVQGHIVLEAPTSEADLPQRLERAYFGHASHAAIVG